MDDEWLWTLHSFGDIDGEGMVNVVDDYTNAQSIIPEINSAISAQIEIN